MSDIVPSFANSEFHVVVVACRCRATEFTETIECMEQAVDRVHWDKYANICGLLVEGKPKESLGELD